jgi:hypothetical protein
MFIHGFDPGVVHAEPTLAVEGADEGVVVPGVEGIALDKGRERGGRER